MRLPTSIAVMPPGPVQAHGPVLEQTAEMTLYIKQYDRQILELAQSEYPETQVLLKIQGVGHITALIYVLTLGSKERFKRSRGCRLLSRSATPTKPLRRARSATRHHKGRQCLSAESLA